MWWVRDINHSGCLHTVCNICFLTQVTNKCHNFLWKWTKLGICPDEIRYTTYCVLVNVITTVSCYTGQLMAELHLVFSSCYQYGIGSLSSPGQSLFFQHGLLFLNPCNHSSSASHFCLNAYFSIFPSRVVLLENWALLKGNISLTVLDTRWFFKGRATANAMSAWMVALKPA